MSTTSTLILGGVRSGKSRLAERLAEASGRQVIYMATATPGDDPEMAARIGAHRDRRPAHWRTVEAPIRLAESIRAHAGSEHCVLVDCLTLWLTNLLLAEDEALLHREREALIEAVPATAGEIVLVANETGLGIVPLGALTRRFVDEAGDLHRRLAERCDRVIFTVAGLPHVLKGTPP